MSGIGKLKIKGIRAFSEDQPAAIEMQSPLTLIVGHNGTGKTTIVEALKYATTGSLPPNSKNGAFIHDPRMSQGTETKAQIMMKFTSCEGKEYIIVRGMTQTVGKIKKETRTSESVLWEIKNGEKRMICNKLSEVDNEVPLLLGTTPAVLENVIFVHQEESTWPLGDSSVVKKKMDGIFSSSRFIKALDALTVLKKEKTSELKILSCKYETLQQRTQNKHVIEQRIARIIERLSVIKNISDLAKDKLKNAQIDLKEKEKQSETVLSELRDKERAQSELQGLSTKPLINKPVSELQSILPSACKEDLEGLKQEESLLEMECMEVLEKIRKFEELKEKIEKNKLEVEILLENRANTTEEMKKHIDASRNVLKSIFMRLQGVLEVVSQEKEKELEKKLGELKSQLSYLIESNEKYDLENALLESPIELEAAVDDEVCLIESAKGLIEQIYSVLEHKLQRKESLIRIKTEEMGILKEKHRNIVRRLEEIKTVMNADLNENDASFITEVQENENVLNTSFVRQEYDKQKIFLEIEELQREIEIALKETEKRKEKEFLQEEIDRKKKELEFIPFPADVKPGATMENILQIEETTEIKIRSLETKIKEIQQSQQQQIEIKVQKESKHLAAALVQQMKIKKIEKILQEITGEIVAGKILITKSEILQRIKEGGRMNVVTGYEDALSDLNESWGGISASEKIYEEFLNRAHEECPFCKSFISTGVSKGHVQKVKTILECIQKKKNEIQSEIILENERTKTKQHQSLLRVLLNEISSLFLEDFSSEKSSEKDSVLLLDESLGLLDTLNKQMRSIKNLKGKYQEIDALKRREERIHLVSEDYNIVNAKYKQKMAELQEIEKCEQKEQEKYIEFENKKQESRDRIKEIEEIMQKRNKYKNEAMSLEKEHYDMENAKTKTETLLHEKSAEIAELHRSEAVLYKAKEMVKECQPPTGNLIKIASFKEKIQEIFIKVERLSKDVYTEDHKKAETDLKQQLIETEDKKELVNKKRRVAEDAQTHKQLVKDSIRAAILRSKIESSFATQQTLFDLQIEIDGIEEAILKEQKIISECVGEEYNLEKQKQEDEADVKIHANAETDELSVFITMKVLKESISDLEKYIKGVQAGIVRYHSEKLAEVNAIIKEIWDLAYKGTDIDEIKIISHLDKTYSISMVKNGVEIDMRGRVSAGQKVLTSIVIRLALAEAFSVNCGFLSLDEPTTNLDKANISGLARALSSIIKARKAEGNFQLLVITHDEEFVRELLATECTEYFYRLERDLVGTPKIVQLSIYDI
ncbi:DNA repair protein RAD50 [Nematocida minor]|uniref:DNA repair protein RAD50 n=1 Tax=Nematocida minor TaxID=1912983 RepID=UPI00222090E2|nr:DNA repair protein RAD50 [Nematocida minor]KAI5190977.1 DNA repair protein RAD50 [Nematocida minor]